MFLKYDMPFSLTTLDLPKKYLFINSCYWSHWFCCEIKAALKVCIFGRKDMTSSGMSVNMRAFIQWPKLEFCAEVFFCAFHHFFTSSFLFCYAHKRRFYAAGNPATSCFWKGVTLFTIFFLPLTSFCKHHSTMEKHVIQTCLWKEGLFCKSINTLVIFKARFHVRIAHFLDIFLAWKIIIKEVAWNHIWPLDTVKKIDINA